MEAFERNLISSRQCCSPQGGITHQKLAYLLFEVLKHPGLAPSDYYLSPNLKKTF
jgi:hypothetical protein